jgi:hypothetical protein
MTACAPVQSKTAISHQAVVKSSGGKINLEISRGSSGGTGRVSAILVQQVTCQEPAVRTLVDQQGGSTPATVVTIEEPQAPAAVVPQQAVDVSVAEGDRSLVAVTNDGIGPQYEVPTWGTPAADVKVSQRLQ